jgi:1-pyrroline-5-carboxylate dehydrogenase
VTPFNFTSIAGNLPTAPALMGNTVIWKPASSAMLSAYYILRLLEAAGLPPGVINFVPGDAAQISGDRCSIRRTWPAFTSPGSTAVFNGMWKKVGENAGRYRSYPRLVGETGGKDFIVAHPSADVQELAVAIARGGSSTRGRSARPRAACTSRVALAGRARPRRAMMRDMKMGDVCDFRTFMGAVIDRKAFDKIGGYLDDARRTPRSCRAARATRRATSSSRRSSRRRPRPSADARGDLRAGGHGVRLSRRRVGRDAADRRRDVAVRADRRRVRRDRAAIREARSALRHAAGNFYINDKPTGAVVGQQPFGGAGRRAPTTRPGSKMNLLRWVSARTIKETFSPPRDYRYPYMAEE